MPLVAAPRATHEAGKRDDRGSERRFPQATNPQGIGPPGGSGALTYSAVLGTRARVAFSGCCCWGRAGGRAGWLLAGAGAGLGWAGQGRVGQDCTWCSNNMTLPEGESHTLLDPGDESCNDRLGRGEDRSLKTRPLGVLLGWRL